MRQAPWLSLVLTLPWLGISCHLISEQPTRKWGHLLYGFALTWLAGSVYWGWLRAEPIWHLPIEAMGLPFAIWGLKQGFARIGQYFYLGSLLGTAVTDLYIHSVHLLPEWRQVMQSDYLEGAQAAFQSALLKMQTIEGILWAVELATLLLVVGLWSLRRAQTDPQSALSWWAFGGAVISTLLVDSLFWLSAIHLTH